MTRRSRISSAVSLAAVLFGASGRAQDLASNLGRIEDEARRLDSTLGDGGPSGGLRRSSNVEERFADAELLYRLRDYSRASVLFTDIIKNYRNTPAYPQGLFLLADSLYQAGDRYGARTRSRGAPAQQRPGVSPVHPALARAADRHRDPDEQLRRRGRVLSASRPDPSGRGRGADLLRPRQVPLCAPTRTTTARVRPSSR